jgi:hypothetical protein
LSQTCKKLKLPSPDVGRRVGDEGRAIADFPVQKKEFCDVADLQLLAPDVRL